MNNPYTFHFPHYLFLFLFVFIYIPISTIFDYFIEDLTYIGYFSYGRSSATAFLLLIIIIYIHKYLFTKKLKRYMIPKYKDEYWNFINNCKHYEAFPISLSKKDVKLLGTSNELNDIKNSILQFGKVARIILILWFVFGIICRLIDDRIIHL